MAGNNLGFGGVGQRIRPFLYSPLERSRQCGRETNQIDGHDDPPGSRLGAQHPAPDRMTHGDVALHRERHRQPNGRVGFSK